MTTATFPHTTGTLGRAAGGVGAGGAAVPVSARAVVVAAPELPLAVHIVAAEARTLGTRTLGRAAVGGGGVAEGGARRGAAAGGAAGGGRRPRSSRAAAPGQRSYSPPYQHLSLGLCNHGQCHYHSHYSQPKSFCLLCSSLSFINTTVQLMTIKYPSFPVNG